MILQKVIRASVYVWLRDFKVRECYRENARFYCEVLAFFDFIDWLDTQATLDISFDLEQAKKFRVGVVCEICIHEIKWILQLNLQHENVSFNISFVVHLRCSVLT